MIEKRVTIQNKTGLHARPATLFVHKANLFKSDISVVKDLREVNAKSIIGIMSLGAGKGEEILIKAKGEDAQVAVNSLAELLGSFSE